MAYKSIILSIVIFVLSVATVFGEDDAADSETRLPTQLVGNFPLNVLGGYAPEVYYGDTSQGNPSNF